MESGSQPHQRSDALESVVAGALSGHLVGQPLAASCMHHGKRKRFDRHDRRDKGIFPSEKKCQGERGPYGRSLSVLHRKTLPRKGPPGREW